MIASSHKYNKAVLSSANAILHTSSTGTGQSKVLLPPKP